MTFAVVGSSIGSFFVEYAGAIAAGSAAVGAVGAYSAARSQSQASEYNATVASQRATVAMDQGNVNEEAQRRRGQMILGTQAAGAADNGGLSGTNVDLLKQSATNVEMDALDIRYGAKLQALSAQDQEQLSRQQARDATTSGWFNAGAAALTQAGNYGQTGRRYGNGGWPNNGGNP